MQYYVWVCIKTCVLFFFCDSLAWNICLKFNMALMKCQNNQFWNFEQYQTHKHAETRMNKMLIWIQNTFVFVNGLHFLCGSCVLFTESTSTDFIKFFFKTGSHGNIHTFKNYFTAVFLVFSNKRYPNRPKVFPFPPFVSHSRHHL